MSNQKRRVIYMTDEEWGLLRANAAENGRTISEAIRDMWALASTVSPAAPEVLSRIQERADRFGHPSPAPKPGSKAK